MTDLLRQYEPWQCGPDGYPYAWHRPGWRNLVEAGAIAIKDLIREQAGHRCQRCGHPYRKGEHGNGEWSPCDEQCAHGGPVMWGLNEQAGVVTTVSLRDEHARRIGDVVTLAEGGGEPREHVITWVLAEWRILTVHHLDEDKANCRWWNLVALCQRCHLRMQRAVVMGRPYHYEHSEWFKPYAAGFYAWKYEGADLSREETMARLTELLAYEYRFTQETLPLEGA